MIIFTNPGEIDIRSISTFGVSVKEGNNPIGFFGTGLKYAIAVLLRTGHRITIMSGDTVVQFGIEAQDVRGQAFDFVTMQVGDGPATSVGFTTELGKQWAVWMAYREIACNCKDEGGSADRAPYMVDPEAGRTQIVVQGDEFDAVFARAHEFILGDEPQAVYGTLEVRKQPSHHFFYRGVRIADLHRPSLFTYSEQTQIELTEDRTAKSMWEVQHRIISGVLQATDRDFIRTMVTAPEESYESTLDFHGWGPTPSAEFLEVVGECTANKLVKVNPSAKKRHDQHVQAAFAPREIVMTAVQAESMERALDFCERIGFSIRGAFPILVVESLGSGILGQAHGGTIYIAERVFHLGGSKQLAATLIEEFVHLRHGWADLTRELQNFLFEKLVSLGEELAGEPL